MISRSLLAAPLAMALLLCAGRTLAYDVALVPASGPAEPALLTDLDEAVLTQLGEQGHDVVHGEAVSTALTKLGLSTVETQKQADMLGASLGVSFVIVPWISPLAGQNRVEILAYFLPDGRAEMLEQIAIEGELSIVVSDMLGRLVTKEGLLSGAPPDGPDQPAGPEDGEDAADDIDSMDGAPTDEELLDKLDEAGGQEPEPPVARPGLGDPFRLHAVLVGGYSILLNEPASGGASFRHGGRIAATIGYVVLPKVGLQVGGDIHAFVGASGVGFGITASTGLHFPVAKRLLVGARLGLGFYKGATGAQRASFLMTFTPTMDVILHDRAFLRFELPHVALLAGGDESVPAVGIMGFNLGVGVRF